MRVVFLGTPDFAIPCLEAVLGAGHDVVLVVSQPDRRRGRRQQPTPSPLRARALEAGLPTRTLERGGRSELYDEILALDPDLAIVVAFGHIIREPLLSVGRHGCINVHASLLPRWRGPAPIHRALLAGDRQTGVCTMRLEAGVDTGDVYLRRSLDIGENETAGELHDRLAALGGELLVDTLAGLQEGELIPTPQPESGVTHAPKLEKDEGSVDFAAPAQRVHDRIRGLDPWPGVTVLLEDQRLKLSASRLGEGGGHPGEILALRPEGMTVACGDGAVCIGRVQGAGGRAMTPLEFARGSRLQVGQRLRPLDGFRPLGSQTP